MKTPYLDKMKACHAESQAQGLFLDWLQEQGIQLAVSHNHTEDCYSKEGYLSCGIRDQELMPHYESIENILARYHGVDLQKADKEKRAILASLQQTQP